MTQFARKHPDASGSHTIAIGEREVNGQMVVDEIKISGRTLYETDNKKVINILRNDPEVIECNPRTKIEVSDDDQSDDE